MSDLISRELAIHVLKLYNNRDFTLEEVTIITEDCAEELRKLPAIEVEPAPKWISVEDKFPHEAGVDKFLVTFEGAAGRAVEMARYINGHLTLFSFEVPDGIITHWMPLPEPPKGERRHRND